MARFWILLIVLFFIESSKQLTSKFALEIISPGNFQLVSVSSMPITAPALDLAVEDVNRKYGEIMTVRLTYLYNKTFSSCEELIAGVDYMVANYYYQRPTQVSATVFIFPGKYDARYEIRWILYFIGQSVD